jgi:hypothetical protein
MELDDLLEASSARAEAREKLKICGPHHGSQTEGCAHDRTAFVAFGFQSMLTWIHSLPSSLIGRG